MTRRDRYQRETTAFYSFASPDPIRVFRTGPTTLHRAQHAHRDTARAEDPARVARAARHRRRIENANTAATERRRQQPVRPVDPRPGAPIEPRLPEPGRDPGRFLGFAPPRRTLRCLLRLCPDVRVHRAPGSDVRTLRCHRCGRKRPL